MTTGRINQVTVRRTTEEASPPSDSDLPRPGLFRREGYRRPANGTPERFPPCTRIDRLPLGKPVDPSTAFSPLVAEPLGRAGVAKVGWDPRVPRHSRRYQAVHGAIRRCSERRTGSGHTDRMDQRRHTSPSRRRETHNAQRERNSPAESREQRDDRPRSGA